MTALPTVDLPPRTSRDFISRDIRQHPEWWATPHTVSQIHRRCCQTRGYGSVRQALDGLTFRHELTLTAVRSRGKNVAAFYKTHTLRYSENA